MDIESLDRWDDYTRAKEAMFLATDTEDAPWTAIKSNDKKRVGSTQCAAFCISSTTRTRTQMWSEPDPRDARAELDRLAGGC